MTNVFVGVIISSRSHHLFSSCCHFCSVLPFSVLLTHCLLDPPSVIDAPFYNPRRTSFMSSLIILLTSSSPPSPSSSTNIVQVGLHCQKPSVAPSVRFVLRVFFRIYTKLFNIRFLRHGFSTLCLIYCVRLVDVLFLSTVFKRHSNRL